MGKEKNREKLFNQLNRLDTEQRNEHTSSIDLADAEEIVRLINDEDKKVAAQVEEKLPEIARAVEVISSAMKAGGRLIYAGAGTSGRLGVLDAAECPPTFGTDPGEVIGLIAGGRDAMFEAQEGAEDFEQNGRDALQEAGLEKKDVVCGIAASGRTPYVHGALKEAKETGCPTIFVTTVPGSQITIDVDILIDVPVGPEAIMGSTRMKSATAQKMILNMLTTGAMVRRGKVYENVMVDLQLSNRKLHERSKRILMMFTGMKYGEATQLLEEAGGHVKTGLLMALGDISEKEARERLEKNDGFIRKALMETGNANS